MRLLLAILLCWSCAAATPVPKTVKPSGGDYTTLLAWEAGRQTNCVDADSIEIAVIEGSWTTNDTNPVTINGSVTDETHYLSLLTAQASTTESDLEAHLEHTDLR